MLLVAAVPTLASLALSLANQNELKERISDREKQVTRVQNTKDQLDRTKEELGTTEKETTTLEQETDTLKNQLATKQAQVSELELRIQTLNDDISSADKKIASYEGLRKKMGEIDEVQNKISLVKNEITDLEGNVDDTENLLAVNNAKKEESDRVIKIKEAMAAYRSSGQNWTTINSTVTSAFNDWGFVVIGAGDDQNISQAAILDVTRDGKPVCKLIITEVQLNQAIADIVPNSLVPGQQVQIGDRVTKPASVSLPN